MNNSDPALELSIGVLTATTSMTTIGNNDSIQSVESTVKLERGDFVQVERSETSSTRGEYEDRPQLIELPYSLRVRKLKIAIIVFMVSLDGFLLPTCLFYILRYGAHLHDEESQSYPSALQIS